MVDIAIGIFSGLIFITATAVFPLEPIWLDVFMRIIGGGILFMCGSLHMHELYKRKNNKK